ncbi:MAG TPA: hypothetical protein VGO60_03770, partial [Iamia sp.]|nr:hypothetical protein [Iamia sp.]
MPAVEDVLADLATHPPAEPTPVTAIRGRAHRRARRRRVLVTAAAVLVMVAAGVALGAAVTDDPGDEVVADGGTTAPSSASSTTATTAPPGTTTEVPVATSLPTMTLDPATGHEDGTVVTMVLDEPATGPAIVAQCAAEAEALGDGSTDVTPWCTGLTEMPAEALTPFTLSRTIETPDGLVDCAEAVGRCTLGVRVGGGASSDDHSAPLVFRADLPPIAGPEVVVEGDEGTVGDGNTLLITATGVEAGETIRVYQCVVVVVGGDDARVCSTARSRGAVVQDGPETQLVFTAFHDVLADLPGADYAPEWTACAPCQLIIEVGERSSPVAVLPMEMEPTDTPIRPTVALDPGGPVAPGERVGVRAAGLQPGSRVPIGWCPAARFQGGGDPPCLFPDPASEAGFPVDDDGTIVLDGYLLPSAGFQVGGADCSTPGTCGIGLDAGDAFSLMALAPLDLS